MFDEFLEVFILKGIRKLLSLFLVLILLIQSIPVSASTVELFLNSMDDVTAVDGNEEQNDEKLSMSKTEEAEILYEITDARTLNSKSFMQSDGTRLIAQYSYPVHYENDNGEFVDFNNTLSEIQGEEEDLSELKPQSSDIDIRISKKTNGSKLVRVTRDKYTISWNFSSVNKVTGEVTDVEDDGDKTTLENVSSVVLFPKAFEDTDIRYTVIGNTLKEDII